MKPSFFLTKCWEEEIHPATIDDVRIAILEILAFREGEGYFTMGQYGRDNYFQVDNDRMVYFSDANGVNNQCVALVATWGEVDQVCQLFLSRKYKEVLGFLRARAVDD